MKDDHRRGKEYIEKLHHYRCFFCKRWWSIGDPEKGKDKEIPGDNSRDNGFYCPWCGKFQEFDKEK